VLRFIIDYEIAILGLFVRISEPPQPAVALSEVVTQINKRLVGYHVGLGVPNRAILERLHSDQRWDGSYDSVEEVRTALPADALEQLDRIDDLVLYL